MHAWMICECSSGLIVALVSSSFFRKKPVILKGCFSNAISSAICSLRHAASVKLTVAFKEQTDSFWKLIFQAECFSQLSVICSPYRLLTFTHVQQYLILNFCTLMSNPHDSTLSFFCPTAAGDSSWCSALVFGYLGCLLLLMGGSAVPLGHNCLWRVAFQPIKSIPQKRWGFLHIMEQ